MRTGPKLPKLQGFTHPAIWRELDRQARARDLTKQDALNAAVLAWLDPDGFSAKERDEIVKWFPHDSGRVGGN